VTLKPAPEYRAELEALLIDGQPAEGDNAWDLMLSAVGAWKTVNEWSGTVWTADMPLSDAPRISVDEMRFGDLDLEARKPGLEFLRRLEEAGAWTALDRAAAAPRNVPPVPWDIDTDPNYLSPAQDASRWTMFMDTALVSAMRVAHVRGDEPEIANDAARLVTIALVQSGGIDTLARAYATGAALKLCGEITHEIQEKPYSEMALVRVDGELARIDPFPSPERILRAMPIAERMFAAKDPNAYASEGRSVAEILGDVDAVTGEAIAQLAIPVSRRTPPGAKLLETRGVKWNSDRFDEAYDTELSNLSGLLTGPWQLQTLLASDAYARTMLAGTRATIAIERYRIANGRLPDSLDALVPAFLAAVPTDPMTGTSMLYRRIENDPHGRAYLVYSTGIDGIDNGGREQAGEMYPSPTDLEAGFDFIVNQPRRSLTQ